MRQNGKQFLKSAAGCECLLSHLFQRVLEFLARTQRNSIQIEKVVKENVDTMNSYVGNPKDPFPHSLELMKKFNKHMSHLNFLHTNSKLPENEFK